MSGGVDSSVTALRLLKGQDGNKDQAYFIYRLG